MRTATSVIFIICAAAWVGAQGRGPTLASAIELDNADVRVRRLVLSGGSTLPSFDHLESVAVFIRGESARVTPEGPSTEAGWKPAAIIGAGRHALQNNGDSIVEVLWVELKQPGSATYRGMVRDAMKVDATRHRVVAENSHVRVLLHTATLGKTGPAHDHPSYLTVLISGVTQRGGPGTFTWTEGPFTHGGIPAAQALEAIVIEPKSGRGADQ